MGEMASAPGWYPDPKSGGQRYFDGTDWTDQFAPAPASAYNAGPPPRKKRGGCFKSVLIFIGVVILIAIIGNSCSSDDRDASNSSSTSSRSATASPAIPPPPAPVGQTPPYSIVGQSNGRFDDQPVYYVSVAPVDLSNDGFKDNVKLVAQAQQKGDSKFSARIFDDATIANEALARDTNASPIGTADAIREQQQRIGQHLVAIYSGGLDANLYLHQLDWYPGAFTTTARVGQYVGNESIRRQRGVGTTGVMNSGSHPAGVSVLTSVDGSDCQHHSVAQPCHVATLAQQPTAAGPARREASKR